MTVVVKDSKGTIKVLCKGADSIIFPLLAKRNKENQANENVTNHFLEEYAKEGLRTLLLVEKVSIYPYVNFVAL
jgi:magnesium-transporting ATPase (P-type)